jgi:hypothetical protein
MSHVARRAATGRMLHVPGRATQRAGAAAQARLISLCRARHTTHGSSGRAVLELAQISRATYCPIWPESTGLMCGRSRGATRFRIIL